MLTIERNLNRMSDYWHNCCVLIRNTFQRVFNNLVTSIFKEHQNDKL